MNLIAISVTYGDRRTYLFKMIDSLRDHGINELILVCNGVDDDVYCSICDFISHVPIKTNIVRNVSNLGSAGGFFRGLTEVSNDVDYILLLDDDNVLDSKEKLKPTLEKYNGGEEEIYCLSRISRPKIQESKRLNDPYLLIGKENSVLGKDIFKFFYKKNRTLYEGDLIVAPYGGLILNKSVINNGIFPNKNLFLYADDYEFTYRLTCIYRYVINVIDNIYIRDVEESHHIKIKKRWWYNRFSSSSKEQIYFSVRNHVYLDKTRSRERWKFFLNYFCVYILISASFCVSLDIQRLSIFNKAMLDGVGSSFKECVEEEGILIR